MNTLLSRGARGALLLCAAACALSCTLPAATPCENDEECPVGGRCDLESYLCVPRSDAGTDDAAGGGDAMHDAGGQGEAGVGDQGQRDTLRLDAAPVIDAAVPLCEGPAPLPASCFTDLFDDGEIDPRWYTSSGQFCTVNEVPGAALRLQTTSGGTDNCSVITVANYDLRDDAVYLRVPPITNHTAGLMFFLKVTPQSGGKLEMLFHQDEFHFVVDFGPGPLIIDPVNYADDTSYWRIRDEGGGHVYFERSADGETYTRLFDVAHELGLGHARIGFGLLTSEDVSGTYSVDVEGYNVSP